MTYPYDFWADTPIEAANTIFDFGHTVWIEETHWIYGQIRRQRQPISDKIL
jgi:hypothetical protein